mgnify:CR=1 FL=1
MIDKEHEPEFLKVKQGDTVLTANDEIVKVLSFIWGSLDPNTPTLFQVANLDSGEIRFIDGKEVKQILPKWL